MTDSNGAHGDEPVLFHIGSNLPGIALCGARWVSPGHRMGQDCPRCLELFRAYRRGERTLNPERSE